MATLSYSVAVASIQQHLFSVSLHIPAQQSAGPLRLTLPSWIPGSYMIRDFARNITQISAHFDDGGVAPLFKEDKQTWLVDAKSMSVTVSYQVFAFDLSVRSAYINDEYAFFNGTSVFLAVEGMEDSPCEMTITSPLRDGDGIYTSMPHVGNATYRCDNYAEIIDHPVVIGQADTGNFNVDGVTFTLLFTGSNNTDIQRICEDLAPVCSHHLTLFGKPYPVDNYLFMTLLSFSNKNLNGMASIGELAVLP